MKKIFTLLLLSVLVFNVKSQDSIVDPFKIGSVIVPSELKLSTKQIDTTKIDSTASSLVTKIDTQTVIVYDTVKVDAVESSSDSAFSDKKSDNLIDSVIPETVTTPKDSVAPLSDIISFMDIFWSLVILIGTYFFIRAVVTIIERFAEKSTNYRITLKSLSPFVRIIGWIIAILWIIEGVFELSNDKLFAFLASAGVAIAFASQDILKNVFGGIMILFDKPFQVGDKIEVGSHYGEVKEIGLRSTRIVTADDSLVSVPNAEVVNSAVSNSNTGEANCQVVAEIYLPIDTDTNTARLIATEAAQVSRYIYLNKPITVLFFNEVKEDRSYYKMRVKAYVSDIRNEFAFKSDMTEIIMKEFLKQGVFKKEDVK